MDAVDNNLSAHHFPTVSVATAPPPTSYIIPHFSYDDSVSKNSKSKSPPTTIYAVEPVTAIPDEWERNKFIVKLLDQEIPVYYYIMRAKDERGVLVGHTGLKSDKSIEPDDITYLNSIGVSVIMMVTPNMGRTLGSMPFLQHVHGKFTLDPDSPVHTLFHKDLPKFLYDHSTSGQFEIDLLNCPEKREEIHEHYKVSICEAPFYHTANASDHDSLLFRTAFRIYATLNAYKLPHETFGGLFYLNYNHRKKALESNLPDGKLISKLPLNPTLAFHAAVETIRDLYLGGNSAENQPWYKQQNEFRTPTYGQILEDIDSGKASLKNLKAQAQRLNGEKIEPAVPLTVIYSTDDPFSCPKTIKKDLGSLLKADFIEASQGQHNCISANRPIFNQVVDILNPHLLKEPLNKTEQDIQEQRPPEQPWSFRASSSRFGSFALKSLTRSMNSLASFAQRSL